MGHLQPHWMDRQRPLSLRWASRPAADYLRQAAGLGAGASAIAKDLASTPAQEVSYPRAKGHKSYLCAARYKRPIWTPGNVIGGMDQLEAAGLIHHARRPPGNRSEGLQSYAQATPELVQLVAEAEAQAEPFKIVLPRETVILRDSDKSLLDYRETGETRKMRRTIAQINEAVIGADIGGCEIAAMARYFNGTLQRGGRFYAQGDSWQNLSAALRHEVVISGEPIVELDFKCLHPAILYAMTGATMPSDAYAVPSWPRDLVKLALLILINAENKHKAAGAIAHSDGRRWERDDAGNPIAEIHDRQLMQALADPGSDRAKALAHKLIDALSDLHKPIAHFFGRDMGAKLMLIDSRMAEAVMADMLAQGVVVLPVHDSFLAPASKAAKLEAAMQKAAYEQGLRALKIEAKTAPRPFSHKQLKLL